MPLEFLSELALNGRRYWKTATTSTTSYTGDSPIFVLDYLLRLFRVLVLLAIWRVIFADTAEYSGVTLAEVLTYTVAAEIFGQQLALQSHLHWAIWEGQIAVRYLQPMSFVGQFVAETLGHWWLGLAFFSLPLFVMSPLLGVNPLPSNLAAAGYFVVSLALAGCAGLALDFIFGGIIVALGSSIWLVLQLRSAIVVVLSGVLIPLALLPWGIGSVLRWSPFAATASTPLQVYTGTSNVGVLLLSQLIWSIVLWMVASWTWNRFRERLVAYGG